MPKLNGKRVGFTEEQKQFLRDTYPTFGGRETHRQFIEKFNVDISFEALKRYCRHYLDLHVTEEFKRKDYESRSMSVGTVRINCRGEAKIKVAPGKWIKATHSAVDVPKGYIAFNLDKNVLNNSPDNIGITTNSKFRTLRNYGMWSEHPEITKTGLIWCDLNELYQNKKMPPAATDGNNHRINAAERTD